MTWLVTGGAGYIGAHVVRALVDAGESTVVLDDLSSGHESFLSPEVPFVRGSILDGALVLDTLRTHAVEARLEELKARGVVETVEERVAFAQEMFGHIPPVEG